MRTELLRPFIRLQMYDESHIPHHKLLQKGMLNPSYNQTQGSSADRDILTPINSLQLQTLRVLEWRHRTHFRPLRDNRNSIWTFLRPQRVSTYTKG
jgi:hypothetical protein